MLVFPPDDGPGKYDGLLLFFAGKAARKRPQGKGKYQKTRRKGRVSLSRVYPFSVDPEPVGEGWIFGPGDRQFQAAVFWPAAKDTDVALFPGGQVTVTGGQLRQVLQIGGGRPAAAEGQRPGDVFCFHHIKLGIAPVLEKVEEEPAVFVMVLADDGLKFRTEPEMTAGGEQAHGVQIQAAVVAEKVLYLPAVLLIGQEAAAGRGLVFLQPVFFCQFHLDFSLASLDRRAMVQGDPALFLRDGGREEMGGERP